MVIYLVEFKYIKYNTTSLIIYIINCSMCLDKEKLCLPQHSPLKARFCLTILDLCLKPQNKTWGGLNISLWHEHFAARTTAADQVCHHVDHEGGSKALLVITTSCLLQLFGYKTIWPEYFHLRYSIGSPSDLVT